MWQAHLNFVAQLKEFASKLKQGVDRKIQNDDNSNDTQTRKRHDTPHSTSFCPPLADYPAGGHPRGRHSIHRQTRNGPRSAAEGGAGVRHPRAQHPVPEDGHQLTQGSRAAAETGRTGGEWHRRGAAKKRHVGALNLNLI